MIKHSQPFFFHRTLVLATSLLFSIVQAEENVFFNSLEAKGLIGADLRYFTEINQLQTSAVAEGEVYWASKTSNDSVTAKLFTRVDDTDDERTHSDIRELSWLRYGDTWELQAGIGKVFWGVTESVHLVDIINQTDAVESADGEEKLGQPMIKLSSLNDWGVIDFFILPYFRERNFVSEDAYLGFGLEIDSENSEYQSSKREKHIDYAFRYSHSISIWDVALSHFSGTSREPLLIPGINAENNLFLTPYYQLIERSGLEVQATVNAWLWKFEAISQLNDSNQFGLGQSDFHALSGGFEYTFTGLSETNIDLGVLSEYHFDSRDESATTALQNDIFLGARLSFNDVQDSTMLAGIIFDADNSNSRLAFIEASRRFGERWVLTVDARFYSSTSTTSATNSFDPILLLDKSDHLTLDATYYF